MERRVAGWAGVAGSVAVDPPPEAAAEVAPLGVPLRVLLLLPLVRPAAAAGEKEDEGVLAEEDAVVAGEAFVMAIRVPLPGWCESERICMYSCCSTDGAPFEGWSRPGVLGAGVGAEEGPFRRNSRCSSPHLGSCSALS